MSINIFKDFKLLILSTDILHINNFAEYFKVELLDKILISWQVESVLIFFFISLKYYNKKYSCDNLF